MVKISQTSKKTVVDIMKQRKLEKIQLAKEKESSIQTAKELEFDKFVRNTARKILNSSSKYNLRVFEADAQVTSFLPTFLSEMSLWAPWSKMLKK